MEWQVIVALAVVIPLVVFPAAFIWYLQVGGVIAVLRARRARAAKRAKRAIANEKAATATVRIDK
jgi:hypothetical protein